MTDFACSCFSGTLTKRATTSSTATTTTTSATTSTTTAASVLNLKMSCAVSDKTQGIFATLIGLLSVSVAALYLGRQVILFSLWSESSSQDVYWSYLICQLQAKQVNPVSKCCHFHRIQSWPLASRLVYEWIHFCGELNQQIDRVGQAKNQSFNLDIYTCNTVIILLYGRQLNVGSQYHRHLREIDCSMAVVVGLVAESGSKSIHCLHTQRQSVFYCSWRHRN